jgi:hypothetical protein
MPTLYTLGLKDNDIVFITDVDEIVKFYDEKYKN